MGFPLRGTTSSSLLPAMTATLAPSAKGNRIVQQPTMADSTRYASVRCRLAGAACAVLALGGCGGPQSTLVQAGTGAAVIAELFWWMLGGAAFIWMLVIGLAIYATRVRPRPHNPRLATGLIIGGGVIFPTVVLAGLLTYGLMLIPELRAPAPADALRIAVSGERWWWRVRYQTPQGGAVELANEVRLPAGQRVALRLTSPDVIHSFWIPSLGGKVDMIPGRTTELVLEPTRTGVYRGACAEYCGTAHALMNFMVVVMEPDAFAAWLSQQAEDAATAATPAAARGHELFLANGCGACHTVRGSQADGVLGPDLTHVGGRLSLGAGVLGNEHQDFVRWIGRTGEVKPGVRMPSFHLLPEQELHAIASYLEGLQ